jgi:hypothetical protein|tara:strand:+ start:739 stop:1095 length:357 start_codon:yes stop_codon:yes gene_type:complete
MVSQNSSFSQLSESPMTGDSGLMQQSFSDRATRVGRRGSKTKQDTSLYTRVVTEASEYGEKLREQFRSDAVAPLMKRKLTRAQVKKRIQSMPPEQRMAMARKWGRPFITLAAQIAGEE